MANKIITDTYYGGSNQIARLPYKTIDALQQMGLYIEEDLEDNNTLHVKSKTQDLSPNKSIDISLDVDNYEIATKTLTVDGYMHLRRVPGEAETYPIWDIFAQVVSTNVNIGGVDPKLSKEELKLIKQIKRPYILTGVDQRAIFITNPAGLKGICINASGKIMNWAEINAITGGIKISSGEEKNQYVHMMKIVSTAGDTCYLTAVSPLEARANVNYLTVKLYIIGGLSTAEGTSAGNIVGQYSCNGYNSTLNKTIVALDLGENKFIYSDGTTSAEALSSSNTTVTGNVLGQQK